MELAKLCSLSVNNLIFEGTDGHKYGLNPFANAISLRKSATLTAGEAEMSYCKPCNTVFENAISFSQHQIEVHKKQHQCCYCDQSFKRHDHLQRHIKSLHSNDRYPCGLCDNTFTRRDMLVRHMRAKHAEQPPVFQCKDCPGVYTDMTELEEHEKSNHILNERHQCPRCNATFKRRDHMLRHVKSQHLHHIIECPICSHPYKRRDHLTRHLREKHDFKS